MPRWVAPGLLLAGALASAWGAIGIRPSAAAPPQPVPGGPAALELSVLSAGRVPEALSTLASVVNLGANLDAAFANPALGAARQALCAEVTLDGTTIYARNAGTALAPASNIKLLTALAALHRLGPDSHFTTEARASSQPVNGVVDGPLFLVGGGNPLLVTTGFRAAQYLFTWSSEPATHLEDLVKAIKAAGIRSITGGVIGDDSRYDAVRALPSWKPSYVASGEIGAVGALVVNGGFGSIAHQVAAASPARAAAQDLTALLRQAGISVGGQPGVGVAPPSSVLVGSIDSLPLREIVGVMLRESDNLAAEMLVKELGYRFGGQGSWRAGLGVLHETLTALGIPLRGVVMVDGSGLDTADRLSCDVLGDVLDRPGPETAIIAGALPVAGETGTLARRMQSRPAVGRVHAKTGSLTGVSALAGYVEPALSFAMLANGLPADAVGEALEDRVAAILASFPDPGLAQPAVTH